MRLLLIIAFSLFLNFSAQAQNFPYDIFKTRTLKEVVAQTTKSVKPYPSMFIATNQLESKILVTFTGKSRPILQARKTFISVWAGMLGHPKDYADLYEKEYLYKEGNDEYWLPTQEPITKYFDKELKENDQMTIYLIRIGAHRDQKTVDCVLLVEEFQKEK
jgi:hypothetical protein